MKIYKLMTSIVIFCCLHTSAFGYKTFDLVADAQDSKIAEVLMFANTTNFDLHRSLIELLPAYVNFTIIVGDGGINRTQYNDIVEMYPNVTINQSVHKLSGCAQRSVLRINTIDGDVIPALSVSTVSLSGVHNSELTLSNEVLTPPSYLSEYYQSVNLSPILGTSSASSSPNNVQVWKYMYGSGSDRIVVGDVMFVGKSTYEYLLYKFTGRNHEEKRAAIKDLYNVSVVPIDSTIGLMRFDNNIDDYMLPIVDRKGNISVLLGDPTYMFPNDDYPNWVNVERTERRKDARELVKTELLINGFNVIDIPMVYACDPTCNVPESVDIRLTWTNGIFNNNAYYALSSHNAPKHMTALMDESFDIVSSILNEYDIYTIGVAHSYAAHVADESIRCTAAILK